MHEFAVPAREMQAGRPCQHLLRDAVPELGLAKPHKLTCMVKRREVPCAQGDPVHSLCVQAAALLCTFSVPTFVLKAVSAMMASFGRMPTCTCSHVWASHHSMLWPKPSTSKSTAAEPCMH